MVIYTDRFTDFPEYSECQMPDNQTFSHFQSIFNQKNHFDFFSFGSIQVWIIVLKTYKLSEQQINPKVLSVANSCHHNENSKNGKNRKKTNAHPSGTTPTNVRPPGQKLGCKSSGMGANFWCKSRGCTGGWLWMKLIPALVLFLNK